MDGYRRQRKRTTKGGPKSPVAEYLGKQIAGDVTHEAINEVVGRSKRKWAIVVLAFVLGAVVASVVVRRQGEESRAPNEQY